MAARTGRFAAVSIGLLLPLLAASVRSGPVRALPSPQRPTYRASVELIPIDVQVVDDDGQPITGLAVGDFEVTIDGRKRALVSADFVDYRGKSAAASSAPASNSGSPPGAAREALPPPPRVVILAVDCLTLDQGTARPVLNAAAAFVRGLPADLEVGLVAYPVGPRIDPTIDHDAVIRGLGEVMPQHDVAPQGRFHLSATDLIELSMWKEGHTTSEAQALVEKLCADQDPTCPQALGAEVSGQILFQEGVAEAAIGTLQSLMLGLAKVQIRKTLVLVSGGFASADQPGARPDLHELGVLAGKAAAAADVNVYTLFIDQSRLLQQSAEVRTARNSSLNISRESDVYGRWLDQFSGAAGGSMSRVLSGDGAPAFDRILSETSAYYLLSVEPQDQERDGRAHELRVKVRGRRANVRGRSWVVVPKPGVPSAVGAASAAPSSAAPTPSSALPSASPAVLTLATAFDRGDRKALTQQLSAPGADETIREFRGGSSPWPTSPRRTAAFALDVALTGLHMPSRFTQEAAIRLLAEYAARVHQPTAGDAFECAWLRTAAAGLEGLIKPSLSSVLVAHAVERCSSDGRLRLAQAVIADQQVWLSAVAAGPVSTDTPALGAAADHVLDLYAAVDGFPAARREARVRAAWLLARMRRAADGLALLENPGGGGMAPARPDDPQLRYLDYLIRGQLLRRLGRAEAAEDAFQQALAAWPGGQAARVALLTLLAGRGDLAGAAALADAVETAPLDTGDPWWVYWTGDYRMYDELRAGLVEAAK